MYKVVQSTVTSTLLYFYFSSTVVVIPTDTSHDIPLHIGDNSFMMLDRVFIEMAFSCFFCFSLFFYGTLRPQVLCLPEKRATRVIHIDWCIVPWCWTSGRNDGRPSRTESAGSKPRGSITAIGPRWPLRWCCRLFARQRQRCTSVARHFSFSILCDKATRYTIHTNHVYKVHFEKFTFRALSHFLFAPPPLPL